ncbi:MAG: hypothetical protein J7K53_11475 [Bacteroidales bacterium]|nr:hypothetical protein [Bacteroidales bacterium]
MVKESSSLNVPAITLIVSVEVAAVIASGIVAYSSAPAPILSTINETGLYPVI